ncbi:hypothetical protein EV132_101373 [Rhizobium sullae]|uniref:Uncharacterized protein n=1 Tax=Rhizobium sullae TaxID=50338 RepID=A0A4R3QGX5_RHISU|nr:hypothetical protein EV132_101373 [Rhizobium sullae]
MRQSEGRVSPAFSVANVSGTDALLVSLWQSNTLRKSGITEERNTTTVTTRGKFRNLSAICCDSFPEVRLISALPPMAALSWCERTRSSL